jgi:uncharacterized protein (DUF2235 family)
MRRWTSNQGKLRSRPSTRTVDSAERHTVSPEQKETKETKKVGVRDARVSDHYNGIFRTQNGTGLSEQPCFIPGLMTAANGLGKTW